MSTLRFSLSRTEYTQVNTGVHNTLVIEVNEGTAHVVVAASQPATNSPDVHRVCDGERLYLDSPTQSVWALAINGKALLTITESLDAMLNGDVAGSNPRLNVEVDNQILSQFGEVITARRFPLIDLNSSYGLSAIRDVQAVTGSGAISSSASGEYLLSTGATASSTARLDSAERIRYLPGYSAEAGIGVRIPIPPTGNQFAKWGIRNPQATDGLYWGIDATGVFTAILRGGIENKTYLPASSIDTLDGNGPSGLTLDITSGNIFQIEYTWYGYGQIIFDLIDVVNFQQKTFPCNTFKPSGATSLQSPNLPIFVEVSNGGDASDFDIYVGGRQASIIGEYNPLFRTSSQVGADIATSTTAIPLVSVRNKIGFENISLRIDSATAIIATEACIIEFYLGATLTGASFVNPTNHTAAETGIEADISATAQSGGVLVFSYYAEAGQANRGVVNNEGRVFNIPENQILTMSARTITGTGTARGYLRMQEEW